MKKLLIISLIFLFSLNSVLATDYNITGCQGSMRQNNRYFLTQDIVNTSSSFCFQVYSSETNVTLDCQGHLVDGIDAGGSRGYYEGSYQTQVTIKNCVFSDWEYGINFHSGNNLYMDNITAFSGTHGIRTGKPDGTAKVYVNNSLLYDNSGYGIIVPDSSNTRIDFDIIIENTEMRNNNFGIVLNAWNGIIVRNNNIHQNNYGVYLDGHSGEWGYNFPKIYNNYFNNDNDVYIATTFRNDFYNPSDIDFPPSETGLDCNRTNVIGQLCYGGNYWTNPNMTGFSNTCVDSEPDGVCDSAYIINSTYDIKDNYPLKTLVVTTTSSTTVPPEHYLEDAGQGVGYFLSSINLPIATFVFAVATVLIFAVAIFGAIVGGVVKGTKGGGRR
jgi:hypothetical protein